jgi:sec-independent protein translocase protein TatA
MFLAIGPNQIVIVLVILILLFGAKRIPDLFRGIGQGIKEFKDAAKGDSKEGDKK